MEGLRLRGFWSEGFKAPNLEVVNIPVLERLNGCFDNYNCEADLRSGRISSFSACTQNYGVLGEQSAMDLDYLARLSGGSNVNVVRQDPSPEEILAFEGTGLDPVGEVIFVNSFFDNLLPQEVAGVDFGISWANEFADFDNLRINLRVTKLLDFFRSRHRSSRF